MVALSAPVYLPTRYVTAIGVTIIALHNTMDGIAAKILGEWSALWMFIHERGPLTAAPGYVLYLAYPVLSWIGVMAGGYGFGALLTLEARLQRKLFLTIGQAMVAALLLLRFTNLYGDMDHAAGWPLHLHVVPERNQVSAVIALDIDDLGPSYLFPAHLEKGARRAGPTVHHHWPRPALLLRAAPVPAARHGASYSYVMFGTAAWLFSIPFATDAMGGPPPNGYGVDLVMVYVFWITAVMILYPLCKWFAEYKRTDNQTWLFYV